MTDAVHDAVLDDWSPCVTRFPDLNFVVGDVRSDRKGRFTDGEMITTSMLVTPIDELREGVFARTRNSVYLLGRRAEKVSMQAFLYAGSLQGRVLDAQGRPVDTMSMAECDADGTSTSEKRAIRIQVLIPQRLGILVRSLGGLGRQRLRGSGPSS